MTTIEDLIDAALKSGREAGLRVRCPKCDAGIGKWCRSTDGAVVVHAERQKAAR